ncbi:hypothetical protein CAEBREN_17907 [Caenorhabditis brenneri]|uniref:Uncharacterized protein n=1 Tax=Caenorhabditis brenneri TaxID=135651 RepID=G0MA48_CAEBE|nr:hypothetical protein CAEBREN_17907 [Caenorhabditis brenneri]
MSYLNSGNPSIIFSILRNFSSDWEQFYNNVDSYLDEFYEHLDNSKDVKIIIEKGSKKDTYAIKIELKRPTEEESHEFRRATYMEVPGHLKKWNSERVLRKAENFKPTLKFPVAIPLICFSSKLLIAIFNYCLFGKKNFDQVLLLRKFLTTQLSGTCLTLDPNQFLTIFNQCLKFDLPCLGSDGEPLVLDIKFEIDKQEYYVSVLDDDFLKYLKKPEGPIKVSYQDSDDEELTSLKNNNEEEIAAAAKVGSEMPDFFNENLSNEEFSPAPQPHEFEDEEIENSESQKKFREDFEEQQRKFKAKLEANREERRKKRMAHKAELKDLRRQQKQRFAALMSCIFLKQRFEEKESEWSSWIENSLRELIVKVVRKFADFQDFAKSFSNFKKLCKEEPEDVISEIGDLNRAILTLLYDLETVFNKLAKVDQDFESVMFIRVIQKRICKVATYLTKLLLLLEEIKHTADWYQNLQQKMAEIQPSQIPTTKELKRICKNLNKDEYKNLEFPKWESKSQVIIEEVDEEDEEFVDINIGKESSLKNLDREQKQSFATQQPQEQEEQMKLREVELRMREDELDKKMDEIKSMEVHLDKKVDEIRLTEENLGRKMEEMMEMMKLVIGSTATAGSQTPATQITGQVQDNTTGTNAIEPSATQSDSTDDVLQAQIQTQSVNELTEDEELRQMEEQFQRAKAEQDRKNELELRIAQERRREMNVRSRPSN